MSSQRTARETTLGYYAYSMSNAFVLAFALSGCASAVVTQSGRLSSYSDLKSSEGMATKGKVLIDSQTVLAAKTVRLIPTIIDTPVLEAGLTAKQLQLVSNAIDRSLCRDLGQRFTVVMQTEPADLEVRAIITHIAKTDTAAAGTSVVAGIGGRVVSAVTGIPVPVPRLPIGLGSLSVEGEAKGRDGRQVAALIWARGADIVTTSARVAEEADAHTLASKFAEDFVKLMVTGKDPIVDPAPMVPTAERVGEFFGADSKSAACRQFGRDPGFGHALGGVIGAPPEWADKGPTKR